MEGCNVEAIQQKNDEVLNPFTRNEGVVKIDRKEPASGRGKGIPGFLKNMIHGELIVDNFAGGGGASTGIELATGYSVDIAINHDPEAIRMHKTNHPNTKHYCEDVWQVDPVEACKGYPVGLAWFSPDCKHFSKAKGGKPKDKFIRGLAWVACRWAGLVRPRVIMLENVEEFKTWGPLNRRKHPIKSKQGKTFEKFVQQLTDLGYIKDFFQLLVNGNRYVSCDYGTQNATVFLLWNKGINGKWYCIREYYYSGRDKGKQKTDSEYADDLKEWLDGTKIKAIIVDPSAASFIAELRKRGYKVLKANNDVLDGIRLVGMLLNLGMLFFSSSCVETIKEFTSYIWDVKAMERGEDKPVKQHDHSMDAVRYFVSTILGHKLARMKEVRG